jgi:hypothetical protein
MDYGAETREKERDATYTQGSWVPYTLPAECLAISSVRPTCNKGSGHYLADAREW